MKIQLIKTKDKYLYKFVGYCYISDHLMNGKEIQETFNNNLYVINEYPNLLQEKETIKINERWTLKNKDLYNETIPLIVDEHSKEKYKNLVDSDLYEYTYEEKEIYKKVELEIEELGEIDDDIPFEHKEILQTEFGWYSRGKKEVYLINEVNFSLKDNCLTPTPIKELTKPCMLKKEFLHQILTDYIKRNIDLTYAKVKDDYDWRFNVVTNNQRQMYILSWSSDRNDKNWTLQNLYANNFKELVKKIKQMENEIITYINKDHVCPYCNGTGCKTEKFDTNKWFSEVNK